MEELLKQMMEQMNWQFDKIDKRFDGIDQRLDGIDVRLENVEASVLSLKDTVENNASEFRSHFRHIENKLEGHDKMFERVSEELRGKNWL